MYGKEMYSEKSGRVPSPKEVDNAVNEKMASIVNSSMKCFHGALELHWNYHGQNFLGVHNFLDAHYKMLLTHFDEIAERAVTLFGQVRLDPSVHGQAKTEHMFSVDGYVVEAEKLCAQIKIGIAAVKEDPVTNDSLVRFLGSLEKDIWQLRSTLGGTVGSKTN